MDATASTTEELPPPPDPASEPPVDGADRSRRHWLRRTVIGVLAAGIGALALLVAANVLILVSGTPRYDTVGQVPHEPVAIVFGAGLDGNGTRPSLALKDRLDAAIALYRAGTVPHLLLTGDNSHRGYDEPSVMRDYLTAHGIPASAITRDFAGFDTYDSCARARHIFGVHQAVLVTQDYHLPRALFTCQHLGIRAVGLAVPDWQHHPGQAGFRYPLHMQISFTVREWFARAKAIWDTDVTHRPPTVGGPPVGLTSN
jgi:vancomycin permeability regulator SanA